ncbi:MAG: N-acetyltransferase [Clostridiales bacterium]|nr:N-acetyltransferase [Clostridiales bacterium]
MEHTGTKTIETERLILRAYRPEDYKAMYRNWASDPVVTRFLTWPTHSSDEITKMIVDSWVERNANPANYHWGITLKSSETGDEVVGDIAVVHMDDRIPAAEIGYCLGRAYWGRGIMTEALKAVKEYLFDAGFLRVCACHDVCNPASGRVMEKAGLKEEGIQRKSGFNNTGVCDMVWRGTVLEDYLKEKEEGK